MLQMKEEDFWRMTPRKLAAMVQVHAEFCESPETRKKRLNKPTGFIDQLF